MHRLTKVQERALQLLKLAGTRRVRPGILDPRTVHRLAALGFIAERHLWSVALTGLGIAHAEQSTYRLAAGERAAFLDLLRSDQ
jgi:hypothetical protein